VDALANKSRDFWDQCDTKSRGTSGQNRIRPERFLEVEIPLPPLDEQHRIVARIEVLYPFQIRVT
jgi:type I restriction enzyme, S subunit